MSATSNGVQDLLNEILQSLSEEVVEYAEKDSRPDRNEQHDDRVVDRLAARRPRHVAQFAFRLTQIVDKTHSEQMINFPLTKNPRGAPMHSDLPSILPPPIEVKGS